MSLHRSFARALLTALAVCCTGGCTTLVVGTAATVVNVGGAVVNVGVGVGKTVVKTGAAAVELAVPD